MDTVIAYLNRLYPLSAPLQAELRKALHYSKKAKNQYLLRAGEIPKSAWYLKKGLVRCFCCQQTQEITTWFLPEDNALLLSDSLVDQQQSSYWLQALENCELYSIGSADILYLIKKYPEAREIKTLIAERFSHLKDEKIKITGISPAAARYQYFETHYSHLLNRLKLEHIASYLDMSKSSLARARRP